MFYRNTGGAAEARGQRTVSEKLVHGLVGIGEGIAKRDLC